MVSTLMNCESVIFFVINLQMHRSKRTWQEPQPEQPLLCSTHRHRTKWIEPIPEEPLCIPDRKHYKLLLAKPKTKALPIHPQIHGGFTDFTGLCQFPRFKRLRTCTPRQSHEKALILKKKNSECWISILAHLHRFSLLYQKTADSRYQQEHVANILSSYNQISTARHLQVWQHFTEWCEPFGFHPVNISTSFLLDFIYEATNDIKKQTYSMKTLLQSLKFVAHHAEVPKLLDILNAPVITGYITSTKKPQNPREVFPLPFHVAISFEHFVLDQRRPSSSRLILGCFLFMFWTGLRFQDLQRTRPSDISLSDGVLRAVCELSKSSHPQPAACIACGFSSLSFSSGWGYAWFNLMKEWIQSLLSGAPDFRADFIFPEVQGEGPLDKVLIPRPMLYYKAASILRHVAKQPFMSPPYTSSEVSTLTVHSTKSSLISAAKQLDLPTHWIAEQGHHRGKRTQGDRYSRDDTTYQLLLQKTIVIKTKQGWRPITPQARGGQQPILQRDFQIPSGHIAWPAFLDLSPVSANQVTDLSVVRAKSLDPSTEADHLSVSNSESQTQKDKAESSDSSSDSSSSSEDNDDGKKQPTGPFILNHFTRIAHLIREKNGVTSPSCGAKFFDKDLYRISDEIPDDYDLCHHKGCSV